LDFTNQIAKNNISNTNKWIKVNLKGCQSGSDAFYAKVMVRSGSNKYYRLKSPYQGNLAQSQLIHFGLGTANTIDSLIVKWPSGRTTILTNVAANQMLTVNEDNNCDAVTANCPDLSGSLLQGLVGYWPFCGNANDESGNGNNGTVNGATLTTDRFGNAGSAYTFQNSSISLPITLQQSFGAQNQAQFTFSCWFKNNDSVFIQPSSIVGGRNSNGTNYTGLHPWPGTKRIRWYVNQATTNLAESNSPNLKFEDITVWNHIVGTFTGGTTPKLQLFYNGILVDTASFQVPLPWIQTNQFNLGIDAFYPRYYTGSLDDIAIWNRALTPQEITQLYNQGICQTSITVTDTLLIHTGITSYNPVAYGNTLKVWPNPGNTAITLDAGNLALMQGWKIRISNAQGVQKYPANGQSGLISQQQQILSMSDWGGNGLYFLYLIDPQNNIQEVKKIVLAP
jgi:hypothetical protein